VVEGGGTSGMASGPAFVGGHQGKGVYINCRWRLYHLPCTIAVTGDQATISCGACE
jgi:hypothetical protein